MNNETHYETCPYCGQRVLRYAGHREEPPDEGAPLGCRHYCPDAALRRYMGTYRECICGRPVYVQADRKYDLSGALHVCPSATPPSPPPTPAARSTPPAATPPKPVRPLPARNGKPDGRGIVPL